MMRLICRTNILFYCVVCLNARTDLFISFLFFSIYYFVSLSNHFSVLFHNKKAVKIMTEVGICYTINNFLSEPLHTNHWSDLNPYPANLDDRFKRENLTFNLGIPFPLKEVIEHNITGNITTYVHSPFDIPTIWSRSRSIDNGKQLKSFSFNIRMAEINYVKNLLNQTTPDVRHCRVINESNLKQFPSVYSRNLCLMECRAHYIQKSCNCIPHFYGHSFWKNHRVCDVHGLSCFHNLAAYRKITSNTKSEFFKCGHCKANCVDQATTIRNLRINAKSSNSSMNEIHHVIHNFSRYTYIRSVMYTRLDIIAGLSGVLSTFLGLSIYSLCDLIYFFTVRIYWFRHGYRGSVDEAVL